MRSPRPHLPLLLALLAASTLACGRRADDAAPTRVRDLVDLVDTAVITAPTGRLDLTDPASDRLLISGWERKAKALWSGLRPAVVDFYAGETGPRSMKLDCRAAGREAAVFAVDLNGEDLGRVTAGRDEASFDVPAGALQPGWNRLTLRMERRKSSRQATAWNSIDFGAGGPSGGKPSADLPLRTDAAAGSLVLAAGHQADFYLELTPGAQLTVEGARFLGDGCGALKAQWQPLGGEPRELLSISGQAPGAARISTDGGAGSLGFRLEATPGGGCEGVAIRRPSVSMTERATAATPPLESAPARQARNVVFFLVDTLRADHLGAYGYDKPTSPELDRFAADATLFLDSQAQSSWTRSSVASVFTGLLPQEHQANDDDDGLADEAVTLAERLAAAGFETAGFTSNGNAAQGPAFDQGFETWKHLPRARSEPLVDEAVAWLRSRDEERPFFLWVHTIDPHAPYEPPAHLRDEFAPPGTDPKLGSVRTFEKFQRKELGMTAEVMAQLVGLYDAEIRNNDLTFRRLLTELETLGLAEDTIVVFLSDHGEEFGEHGGWSHGKTLYAEMLETPLVIRFPDLGRGRRVDFTADHIDLVPTVLDYFGLAVPESLTGRSLLPFLEGDTPEQARRSFAHLDLRGRVLSSVITGPWKYVAYAPGRKGEAPSSLLYRRDLDTSEEENLMADEPGTARALSTLLESEARSWTNALEPAVVDTKNKELQQELRALGYIN